MSFHPSPWFLMGGLFHRRRLRFFFDHLAQGPPSSGELFSAISSVHFSLPPVFDLISIHHDDEILPQSRYRSPHVSFLNDSYRSLPSASLLPKNF